MCGLESLAAFTHHVESLLDQVRSGSVPITPRLIDAVLASRDQIRALLAVEVGGSPVDAGSVSEVVALLKSLSSEAPETRQGLPGHTPTAEPAVEFSRLWSISFRPSPDILACGGNPALLFRELGDMGECKVTAHLDAIPSLDALDPNQCYLSWTISLRTSATLDEIRDVFMFVEDGSDLRIEEQAPEAGGQPVVEAPLTDPPMGGLGPAAAPHPQTVTSGNGTRSKADSHMLKALAGDSTVRVPVQRLDRLVSLVGELVMNQSRLAQAVAQGGDPSLAHPVQELERLIGELRDDVLGIRMLPIGTIFGRFRRLVHDLSTELGKEVELITEGEETELDKSILDQLGEPLIHLLRNSIDHGIEPAEEREARGKPRTGTISLTAAHIGSDVVVSVEDDGRGINRAAVRARAVERQLIAADAELTEREVLNLLLLPGFSTAGRVTSVSGRGVGMDVVKRQIDAMRATLSIHSEEGHGMRVSLRLPLTLAIIEGLLVQIDDDQFIIPMSVVRENVDLESSQKARHNERNVISVRGELVPYVDLRQLFGMGGRAPGIEKVVIVRYEGERVGFVVDRVLGTHQTVLQSLGRFFRDIEVVSGATIMGDGRVSLILDVPALIRQANRRVSLAAPR
jgi:two-component system chemotaxis sensor kinase CheA